MPMAGRKHPSEVRFSIEARQPDAGQLEAGEKLFGRLTARARAGVTGGRSAPNEGGGTETSRIGVGGGGSRLPRRDPPHSLTGGSQTPLSD